METSTLNMTFPPNLTLAGVNVFSQGKQKLLVVLPCPEMESLTQVLDVWEKDCNLRFLELQFPKNLPSEWTLQRIHTTLALPNLHSQLCSLILFWPSHLKLCGTL